MWKTNQWQPDFASVVWLVEWSYYANVSSTEDKYDKFGSILFARYW